VEDGIGAHSRTWWTAGYGTPHRPLRGRRRHPSAAAGGPTGGQIAGGPADRVLTDSRSIRGGDPSRPPASGHRHHRYVVLARGLDQAGPHEPGRPAGRDDFTAAIPGSFPRAANRTALRPASTTAQEGAEGKGATVRGRPRSPRVLSPRPSNIVRVIGAPATRERGLRDEGRSAGAGGGGSPPLDEGGTWPATEAGVPADAVAGEALTRPQQMAMDGTAKKN